MTNGTSGNDKIDPNLVPLLDVVFQLIMFFVLSTNFVMEQVNATITLPEATAAKSLDTETNGVLFLNVNKEGNVLVPDKDPLQTPQAVLAYLGQKYDTIRRLRELEGKAEAEIDTLVIIRADRDTPFKDVHAVMRQAKTAGFSRIQLRAKIGVRS